MSSEPADIENIVSGIESLHFGGWLGSRTRFVACIRSLRRALECLQFKMLQSSEFPLIVALQGGTGTGKSSVFNGLIGIPISRVGVERPQTRGSIFFIHQRIALKMKQSRLLTSMNVTSTTINDVSTPIEGQPGGVTLVKHDLSEWEFIVLVDSPDLDSVESANRELAEEILLMSDLVIFVTSQEKYADQTSFQAIREASYDRKPFLLAINKLDSRESIDDLYGKMEEFGLKPFRDIQGLSRIGHAMPVMLDESLVAPLKKVLKSIDRHELFGLSKDSLGRSCLRILGEVEADIQKEVELHTLVNEALADSLHEAREWLDEKLSSGLDKQTEQEIKNHVRMLLTKYDFLRTPRSIARKILRLPESLLGLATGRRRGLFREPDFFSPACANPEPLREAHAWFQQSIARFMSQHGLGVLYSRVTQEGLFFTPEELNQYCTQAQKETGEWLKGKFQELKQGLSRRQEFGLYSASVLAAILIVAIESVAFGGITFFELVLDTAIAPFIPRGVLELFVYDQIKAIGRELDRRHRDSLSAILDEQAGRLERFFEESMSGSSELAFVQGTYRYLMRKVF